jgi:hypothetical protein
MFRFRSTCWCSVLLMKATVASRDYAASALGILIHMRGLCLAVYDACGVDRNASGTDLKPHAGALSCWL